MLTPAQIADRRLGIGGSDVAAAVRSDPYSDRADKSRRCWHKDDEPRGNPMPPPRRSGPRARGGHA